MNKPNDNSYSNYKNKTGNYKRQDSAAKTGLNAMLKLGDKDVKVNSDENWEYWFLFETEPAKAIIADLANQGKSVDEIKKIIDDCYDAYSNGYDDNSSNVMNLANYKTENVYYDYSADRYIPACVEAAKENKIKHSSEAIMTDYLIHYNKNHSPKNGQFISGDGDGDGVANDNAHSKYELKGGSKTAFGGQTKKEYKKKLEEDYRKQGVRKIQSKRFAMNAAFQNEVNTKGYNKRKAENAELVSKAKDALSKGDYKSYNAYCKKIVDTYRKARANEEAIKRASEIGRAAVEQSDIYGSLGVLGATLYENSNAVTTAKIFKEINDQVDKEME